MSDAPNDPRSEYGLEKQIRIEAQWFGSEEAEHATMLILQEHCHHMRALQTDLMTVRVLNRQRRTVKGKEIDHPLARSWHK